MSTSKIRMLKIVYGWLLKHGHVTTGEWNYYGGHFELLSDPNNPHDYKGHEKREKELREKIKTVGVNWHRTEEPVDSVQSAFNSTFDPSTNVPTTLGKLVLNDGSEIMIATKDKSLNLEMVATVLEMSELESNW